MFGCRGEGCARAFVVVGVCCVCVVAERTFCVALGVLETLVRYGNGG